MFYALFLYVVFLCGFFIEYSLNSSCLYLGLERKLKTAADTLDQLSKDKCKLQNDISDMMKESGDSSVQLTKMNEDLTQKERYHTLLHSVPSHSVTPL